MMASGRLGVFLGRDGTLREFFVCKYFLGEASWSGMVSVCAEQESSSTKPLGILN